MRMLVLGDSSSAGIGAPQAVYPALLHELLGGMHRIENHATPGFTSADAARYYLRSVVRRRWDVLVIYLGNNEGAISRYKGVYRGWSDIRGRLPSRRRRPAPVDVPTLPRLVFDERQDPQPIATTPADFRANLVSIVRAARRHGTRVILINPIAHERFPAALMAPNAAFHRIVGLPARVAGRLSGSTASARMLVAAIEAHERGDLTTAGHGYHQLATGPPPMASVALNNLAVMLDQRGLADDAIAILVRLADREGTTGAVATYNLSQVFSRQGRFALAREYQTWAADRDRDLYRVKAAYRQQAASLASEPNVHVIDLAQVLPPDDFVDYCHPTAAGHWAIAARVAGSLCGDDRGTAAEPDAGYVCVHPSPDTFFDFPATLLDRYPIALDADPHTIQREAASLLRRARELGGDLISHPPQWPAAESGLAASIHHALRQAADHPLITSVDDLAHWLPTYGYEVGGLPEFYLYRIFRGYLQWAESAAGRAGGSQLADIAGAWRLTAAVYQQRALSLLPGDAIERVRTEPDYGRRVLAKVRHRLMRETTLFDDTRATRLATIRYWYLREALRYGTHSRDSMLYPRWRLETLVEGLYVCVAVARYRRDTATATDALSLLEAVARLRDVHERHARRYREAGCRAGAGLGACGDDPDARPAASDWLRVLRGRSEHVLQSLCRN